MLFPFRSVLVLSLLWGASVSGEELFRDLSLEGGFNLSAVTSTSTPLELGPILVQTPDTQPQWRLAQWGTRFNLMDATPTVSEQGDRGVANAGKAVVIHNGGLGGEGVTLTVLGGAEYGGALRKQGELWPHLLVEQAFTEAFRFTDFSRLDFALDFKVVRCTLATEKEVRKDLHTGQITAFFSVHNKNRESTDFNDMIWFGLPIFDVRFELPNGHQAVDRGKDDATGKFICTLPGSQFYEAPTGDGKWHALRGDLVPLMTEALAASQAKGFLKDTKLGDLLPSSFNLGWEVPGPYDCEITLKGLSLNGVRADKG